MEAVRPINVVSLITIALLSGLFAAAIANVSRPEVHKRLMVLVMVVLLQAAVALRAHRRRAARRKSYAAM